MPLAPDKPNVIVITATLNTTWAPAIGGMTTCSNTLSVFSTPVRLSLRPQGNDAILDWTGAVPPLSVQAASTVDPVSWTDLVQDIPRPVSMPAPESMRFYRVTGQ